CARIGHILGQADITARHVCTRVGHDRSVVVELGGAGRRGDQRATEAAQQDGETSTLHAGFPLFGRVLARSGCRASRPSAAVACGRSNRKFSARTKAAVSCISPSRTLNVRSRGTWLPPVSSCCLPRRRREASRGAAAGPW